MNPKSKRYKTIMKILDKYFNDTKCELANQCDYYQDVPSCNEDKHPTYCGIYKDVTWRGLLWRLRK